MTHARTHTHIHGKESIPDSSNIHLPNKEVNSLRFIQNRLLPSGKYYLVVKCRRFGWMCYLHIYGSTIWQIDRAGVCATSAKFYHIISLLQDGCRHINTTSRICNYACLFVCVYRCTLSAACAVHSVPPLRFDLHGLRFWVWFLAACEIFFTAGASGQFLPFTHRVVQWESRPLAGYKTVGALKWTLISFCCRG